MAYVITEPFMGTKEQSCVAVCPVDCIHDVGQMFVIDPDDCIDCGACEREGPVEPIFASESVPADRERFIDVNAVWVTGGAQAVESALSAVAGLS